METAEFIRENKVIVICRRLYGDALLKLAGALRDGGVRLMEITFDQSDESCENKTCEAIRALCREFGEDMRFGAGTVLSARHVAAAADAGAQYIISPNTDEEVIAATKAAGLVSMPGAMTPTEIVRASKLGADFVKLFPAGWLGFDYIKDISAPLSNIRFVATGGVTEENFGRYLENGFTGAGISGRLTDKRLIADGDYAELTRRAAAFCEIAKKATGNKE